MQYARFGRTGLTVSRLCIGTAMIGKQTDETEAYRIFDRAADAGINFIDTANTYPGGADFPGMGASERIIGRWLHGKRDAFIVATKAGARMGEAAWHMGTSRKHLLDEIDGSLRRLGTDYVDLYQLHADDPETPLDETAEALDTIVRSGKARYVGVSNFLAYRLARLMGRQDALRLVRFVSVQPRYNLLFREIERELLPLAAEEGLAVIPFNPLAGGLLSGKYHPADAPDQGRFSQEVGKFGAIYQSRYWHQREFDTVEALRQIAEREAIPLTGLSVAWILANPTITSVILGASRAEQLDETLAAAGYELTAELKVEMDDLTQDYRKGDATR
jgi:1-deoxyxylulose-5-phosphate synthase